MSPLNESPNHRARKSSIVRQITTIVIVVGIIAGAIAFLVGQIQQNSQNVANTTQNGPSTSEFLAYTCTFKGGTELAEVHAAVTGPDGLPLSPQLYTLNMTNAATETLPVDAGAIALMNPRAPVMLTLVLDTTSTMPINEVQNAIRDHLLTRLLLEDQMRILQFDTAIYPQTEYTIDKNALYNDHILNLELREGDNRLYDAILQAVTLTQPNSPVRQVILVITDSHRGVVPQASQADIITRAQASKTQIFTIGFGYEDNPDQAELFAIANETRGRSWVFNGERSRSAVEQAISTSLESFSTALNSEVIISVNLEGQTPDESGLVPLTVNLVPTSGATALTDTVSCPLTGIDIAPGVTPPSPVTIAFLNIVPNLNVKEIITIEMSVQPEEYPPELAFVFWLDDEMNDQFPDGIYLLDPEALGPGSHTLRAELVDPTGNVVASTSTVSLNVQRDLQLSLAGASTANLTGMVEFDVSGATGLPNVTFVIASANNPSVVKPLGSSPVTEDGTASLQIADIQQIAGQLFPNQTTWELLVTALTPGETGTQAFAESNPLSITVGQPASGRTNTPAPSPTSAESTLETSVPVSATEVALVIRSVSGNEIGNGTLRVYYEDTVQHGQTTRVELELYFNNYYITPTPFGPRTVVPANTTTPGVGATSRSVPTSTPRIPQYEGEAELIEIYELMGASLLCSPASFSGCDEQGDTGNIKPIDLDGASWTWIIAPREGVDGLQDLQLELWRLISINDAPELPDIVWNHEFQIGILSSSVADSGSIWVIIGGAALVVALVGGYALVRSKAIRQKHRADKAGYQPKIFMSYRRSVSWGVALKIHDHLNERGADVFMDIHDLKEGRFEEAIKGRIESCDYFLLLLAPATLESEWVIKEAQHALAHNRKIVPVLTDGFDLYKDPLPESLQAISSHNAITLTIEYFDAGLERLGEFVGLPTPKQ